MAVGSTFCSELRTSHGHPNTRRIDEYGGRHYYLEKDFELGGIMNKRLFGKGFMAAAMVATMWILPIAAIAQTQVVAPKNKYKVQDDVREGAKAAAEIEKVFPVLNDRDATNYVENVGRRLVRAIPQQFNQPAFVYRFQVVNASDINAFALPGGPMYVNRGMIEKARNEGEMAGVMAHEISHIALRHATAQATEQGGIGKQLGILGMILGGAILGGEAGAQLGMLGAQVWMTKFSRKYETQSDVLGARIMADAGYDPRDLANMFRTIEGESKGSGAPEWLSSHPNPGNRYEAINREAQLLRVSSNPIKITRDFERVQARLRAMPPAKTMAQLEKEAKTGQGGGVENPTNNGRYSDRVAQPSTRTKNYAGLSWVRVNVPQNWREFGSADDVQFAPEGAYGNQGLTHGTMLGIYPDQSGNLQQASENYLNVIVQNNAYLRQRSQWSGTTVGGRQAYTTTLSGTSPVTRRSEVVTVYMTQLRSGNTVYIANVVPEGESYAYDNTFRNILNSIRFSN